jgi:hypothetical protein
MVPHRKPRAKTSSSIWLAHGDVERPADPLLSGVRQNACKYFLDAVRRYYPKVLKRLRGEALDLCKAVREEASTLDPAILGNAAAPYYLFPNYRLTNTPCTPASFTLPPVFEHFDQAVARWAMSVHLDIPILMDTARLTLYFWALNAENARKLRWHHVFRGWPVRHDETRVRFIGRGWDPHAESRTSAHVRLVSAFQRAIKKYLDAQERKAQQGGAQKVPKKIQAEHFDWLALYQVGGLSYSEIARRCASSRKNLALDRKTIKAGVFGAGKLVAGDCWRQWRRPASKGGRPTLQN